MKITIQSIALFLTLLISISPVFASGTTLNSGSLDANFSSWGSPSIQGDWKIIEADGKHFIQLSDNFKAKEGPDVKIFLSPLASSDITGKNAADGSAFVKLVTNFEGHSRIEIPANIDLSLYQSLVFHCEQYSKLWGTSSLSQTH